MVQGNRDRHARLYDTGSIYGWISILLHWVTAVIVIALWFLGRSIINLPLEEADGRRGLHVSVAATAWLLLILRAAWRFRSGHPHARGQSDFIHRIAVIAHYAMLTVLLLMLLSGPLMVWAGGRPIVIFDAIRIPGPIAEAETLGDLARFIHSNAAMVLFWLVILHIGGALKHLMFHTDDTFARMIWPGNDSRNGGES